VKDNNNINIDHYNKNKLIFDKYPSKSICNDENPNKLINAGNADNAINDFKVDNDDKADQIDNADNDNDINKNNNSNDCVINVNNNPVNNVETNIDLSGRSNMSIKKIFDIKLPKVFFNKFEASKKYSIAEIKNSTNLVPIEDISEKPEQDEVNISPPKDKQINVDNDKRTKCLSNPIEIFNNQNKSYKEINEIIVNDDNKSSFQSQLKDNTKNKRSKSIYKSFKSTIHQNLSNYS